MTNKGRRLRLAAASGLMASVLVFSVFWFLFPFGAKMHERQVSPPQLQTALEVIWIISFVLVGPGFLLAGQVAGNSDSTIVEVLAYAITIVVNACLYSLFVLAFMALADLLGKFRNRAVS